MILTQTANLNAVVCQMGFVAEQPEDEFKVCFEYQPKDKCLNTQAHMHMHPHTYMPACTHAHTYTYLHRALAPTEEGMVSLDTTNTLFTSVTLMKLPSIVHVYS